MYFLKFFPLLFLTFLIACKNDKCEDLILQNEFFQPIYENASPGLWTACVNPNNGGEIAFPRNRTESQGQNLVKYNSVSNETTILVEDMYIRACIWNSQDWIIFYVFEDVYDSQNTDIWKVRSNGEDLTRLTFSQDCTHPVWRNNGNEFIARRRNNDLENPLSLYSKEGETLDSFSFELNYRTSSWKNDNEFVYLKSPDKLISGNLETGTLDTLQSEDGATYDYTSFIFINDFELIGSYTAGIFKVNVNSGKSETIKMTCNAEYYIVNAYSPTDDRLIMKKIKHIPESDYGGRQEVQFVSMKIDGTDERIFDF